MRRIIAGEMPTIPDSCGPFMQGLIPRCWAMNPESRPSFEDILDEFRVNNFALFPAVDATAVREYVTGVLAWEAQCRFHEGSTSAE
jgi:hypothetical protein